jgi:hypothetical protein
MITDVVESTNELLATKPLTALEWYRFLTSAQDRLNLLLLNLDPDLIKSIFGTLYPCSDTSVVDAIDLNGLAFTNLASVLNGFLAFSDSHGRTFRLSPVYSSSENSEKLKVPCQLQGFVVTVNQTRKDDSFPVFPD